MSHCLFVLMVPRLWIHICSSIHAFRTWKRKWKLTKANPNLWYPYQIESIFRILKLSHKVHHERNIGHVQHSVFLVCFFVIRYLGKSHVPVLPAVWFDTTDTLALLIQYNCTMLMYIYNETDTSKRLVKKMYA